MSKYVLFTHFIKHKINDLNTQFIDYKTITNSTITNMQNNNLSSYLVFVSNRTGDELDASFGKNNENNMYGLGKALAMYGWFKGENKTSYPYTNLINKSNLNDIINDSLSYEECMKSSYISALIAKSTYANNIFNNALISNIGIYKSNYYIMNTVLSSTEKVDAIRNNTTAFNILKSNTKLFKTSGTLTVPNEENRTCIIAEMIGKGATGENGGSSQNSPYGGGSGNSGEYKLVAIPVTKGQNITVTISSNVTIGSITANMGSGTIGGGYGGIRAGSSLSQSGKFVTVGAGGAAGTSDKNNGGCGGNGGILFDGYPTASGGTRYNITDGYCGKGGIGYGAGGGGGYGGGNTGNGKGGAGAQGAILVYL